MIKECGFKPQFELPVTIKRLELEYNAYVYKRDLAWIDQCGAMIAEVTNPSHGVGYEIAYAKHVRQMPILCVAVKDTSVSAMIAGDIKVYGYRDSADCFDLIRTFLESLGDAA